MQLVNIPEPFPSVEKLFAVVGEGVVLQHTPRAVTEAPPLLVIFPPPVAPVYVLIVITVVVILGN